MYFYIRLQEEEWARQEALRIQQQEDEEAAKRAALQPPTSNERYDLPPEVCSIRKQNLETGTYVGTSIMQKEIIVQNRARDNSNLYSYRILPKCF